MFSNKSPNPATGQPGGGDEPSRKGHELRVLIVEDEFFIALDAQEKVESQGHSVVGVAVSASQALEMVAQEKPDIVLMDIRLLGEPDGISAAESIDRLHGIRSLFVTANTDPSTLERARRINPIGILHKPLNARQLKEALDTL